MKKLLVLILVIISTSSIGCWGRSDVRNLGIVAAMGIDKAPDGYCVSIQLLDTKNINEASANQTPFTVFSVTGTTFSEALQKLTLESPKKIYFANVKLIIIGEQLARDGINPVLDFLLRNYQMRVSLSLVIAKNTTAQKIIKSLTPIERNPQAYIMNILTLSPQNWGQNINVELDQLANSIKSDGKSAVLSGIVIGGNSAAQMEMKSLETTQSPASLELDNLGAFKDDRLVGWLSAAGSRGYNYITGNIKSTVENVFYSPRKAISLVVKESHSQLKSRMDKGEPIINIRLNVVGDIGDTESGLDITKLKNIEILERLFANKINSHLQVAIAQGLRKYRTDIFGFGEVVHRAHPRVWKGLKTKWQNQLQNVRVTVRVAVKIMDSGVITKPRI
jgi:spore germination protein KC